MSYIGTAMCPVCVHRRSQGEDGRRLQQARSLFREFHNKNAPRIVRTRCQRIMPKLLVDIGQLRGLIYRSDRQKSGKPQTFIHFMESPTKLACDPDGRQLYILGGNYKVTRNGIEG